MTRALYTIGYATKPMSTFIAQLKQYDISAIADVRSVPYSKVFVEYHQEALKNTLADNGIKYVYLGDELGPRSKNPDHYDSDRQVNFDRLSQSTLFLSGIQRLHVGLKNQWCIALLCAEKDPADCHRSLLIGRALSSEQNIQLHHITHDGQLESQSDLDARLTRLHGTAEDLFCSGQEKVDLAYQAQNKLKAYRKP